MQITSELVRIPGRTGDFPVYLVHPSGPGPFPAVIVVMEAFGLNSHIKDVADRVAREGYVAIAPDMYHRAGENSVAGYDNLPRALKLMGELRDEQIVEDISAVTDFLEQQPCVRRERIGIMGFCMGGRISFLTACHNPAIKAAVSFYGGGIASGSPKAPLDDAVRLESPMLLFFGGDDPFIPGEDVNRIRQRLASLGKNAQVNGHEIHHNRGRQTISRRDH